MNRALLDTDILSEIGKGIDSTVCSTAVSYRRTFGRFTLSVITIMEIVRGFQKKSSADRLQRFLKAIASEDILSLDQQAAELAGCIAGDLDRTGQPIGMADPMIAAIAISHGLELVTGNIVHFDRVRQLGYPLALVNWRHPGKSE